MPKVSVILTTRNRARMLHKTIAAILAQTYRDFELLILDDASTDETSEIVKLFDDPRILYFRQSVPRGSAENWAEGLRRSLGDYILQQHDDDLPHPTLIAREVAMLDANPSMMMVGANTRIINAMGDIVQDRFNSGAVDRVFAVGEYIRCYMEHRFTFKCSTQMVRRRETALVEQAKRHVSTTPPTAHIGCLGDIFNICRCNAYGWVGYIAEPLLDYRVHQGSETFNSDVVASDLALHQAVIALCERAGLSEGLVATQASMLRYQILAALDIGEDPSALLCKLDSPLGLPGVPTGRTRVLTGKRVAIFGSFLNAYLLAVDCFATQTRVECFLDDNILQQGKTLLGLAILPVSWLRENTVDAVLLSNEKRPKEQCEANIHQYTDAPCVHWKEL